MIHNFTICPTCGSKKIKRVRRKITREYKGEKYSVPAVQFHECPDCGERVFSPDAVRKILSYSPANAEKKIEAHPPVYQERLTATRRKAS